MENIKEQKVLFVCLGNICRSPAGEGVFNYYVEKEYLQNLIIADSAGLIGYHAGEKPDRRMITAANKRGYKLESLARRILPEKDFSEYDYIVGMDKSVVSELKRLAGNKFKDKIYLMTDFCKNIQADEVPDPYYGTMEDFNYVLDILEDSCYNLLQKVKNNAPLSDY